MATAFLLAAGFGTRLRPLTEVIPKPMLPICGIPMLDYALAHVRAHGHEKVIVNAHHLWHDVSIWANDNDIPVLVEEPVILGTGGGLRAALDDLAECVVVVNADILSNVDLTALVAAVPENGAAMALRAHADADRIGPVEADESGSVVRITSVVPASGGVPGTHFTGVHAMSRSAIERIPDDGEQCVIRTAYKSLVPEGRVGSVVHDGEWIDVGTPQAYLAANLDVLRGAVTTPIDPWTRGKPGPGGSWMGLGSHVAGTVERCVLGPFSIVPDGAHLVDCVVWGGVVCPAERLERAIIYDGGKILQID